MVNKAGRFMVVIAVITALLMMAISVNAQMEPAVEVSEQVVLNGTVTVAKVVSEGPGFIVIHKDNGEGSFGPVIGYRWVNPGENFNISVPINASEATSTLYAMLHVDSGEVGVYEFGTVEGADGPVVVDGAPLSPGFSAAVINAHDHVVEDNTFVADSVTVDAPGFLVIHSEAEGRPGPVIGFTPIEAGTTSGVSVELDEAGMTPVVWPMLHVDSGEAGVYEFGTVEGADGPVRLGGAVAAQLLPEPRRAELLQQDQGAADGQRVAVDVELRENPVRDQRAVDGALLLGGQVVDCADRVRPG